MDSTIKTASELLRAKGLKLATAESCTGGMIAAGFTDLAGSSDIFDRGFVTYSNQAKIDMLGVSPTTLEQHGAVSEQTAGEMAMGALKNSLADVSISVTGIAGPSGGTPEKPVGLVFIGIGQKNGAPLVTKHNFGGDRASVRRQTTITAIENLIALMSKA
jgi:nicotinamide-nucleotide amidase